MNTRHPSIKIITQVLVIFIFNIIAILIISLIAYKLGELEKLRVLIQDFENNTNSVEIAISLFTTTVIVPLYEELLCRFNINTATKTGISVRIFFSMLNFITIYLIFGFNQVIFILISILVLFILIASSRTKNKLSDKTKYLNFNNSQILLNYLFVLSHPIFLSLSKPSIVLNGLNFLYYSLIIYSAISLCVNSMFFTQIRNSFTNKNGYFYSVFAHGIFNLLCLLPALVGL